MDAIFGAAGFVPTPPAVPYDVHHFTHPLDQSSGITYSVRTVSWGAGQAMILAAVERELAEDEPAPQIHRVLIKCTADARCVLRCYRQVVRQLRPVERALRRLFDGSAARNVAVRCLTCLDACSLIRLALCSSRCHGSVVTGELDNSPAAVLWPTLLLRDWHVTASARVAGWSAFAEYRRRCTRRSMQIHADARFASQALSLSGGHLDPLHLLSGGRDGGRGRGQGGGGVPTTFPLRLCWGLRDDERSSLDFPTAGWHDR